MANRQILLGEDGAAAPSAAPARRASGAADAALAGARGVAPRGGYKRAFDLAFLAAAHLLLFPLWALLWIAIPLAIWLWDRGPVFYAQERLGMHGRRFRAIKFRTMEIGAEKRTGPVWASEDDERVTPVGRVLRRLRLDEMPQLINILRGEMSLVGPRPERPVLAEWFSRRSPGFARRLRVRPGVAGLAQVRGGYWTNPRHKLRYDNLYIERMSPWLDLRLVFLSVLVALAPGRQGPVSGAWREACADEKGGRRPPVLAEPLVRAAVPGTAVTGRNGASGAHGRRDAQD